MNAMSPIQPDVQSALDALRTKAGFFRSKRRKDAELYDVLAECLALCERCERDGITDALRDAHIGAVRSTTGRRKYFEADADVYLIVGRYVFEEGSDRARCWRYTAVMREAAKRQIGSAQLAGWLMANGGANALFRARPVAARTARTKTLHLNSQVTVPKEGRFTLVLERDGRGFFNVIEAKP